jgi:peptidoglycan/xylan/chitin deacetylase (PgdA/CDA1 family)
LGHHGDRRPLSVANLREIHRAGHRIGCHSHSHFNLAKVPRENWSAEILDSKKMIEDIIGDSIEDFSFPFGMPRHFSKDLADYCYGHGFSTVSAATPGMLYAPDDSAFLNRTSWSFEHALDSNLECLSVDGRLFVCLTGRSPVG